MSQDLTIIGERINTTRESVAEAVNERDKVKIKKEAKIQIENGTDYLDINCGTNVEEKLNDFLWILETVCDAFEVQICLDSMDEKVIKKALSVCKDREIIINSITADPERFEKILPIVKESSTNVVALTMDSEGLPKDVDGRLRVTERLLEILESYDIDKEKVLIDPLVRPISTEPQQASKFITTLKEIKKNFGVRVISGVSNVSYGLPNRAILNSHFLSICVYHGLDAAIIDPSQKFINYAISSSLAISGRDQYGMNYIKSWRNGKL